MHKNTLYLCVRMHTYIAHVHASLEFLFSQFDSHISGACRIAFNCAEILFNRKSDYCFALRVMQSLDTTLIQHIFNFNFVQVQRKRDEEGALFRRQQLEQRRAAIAKAAGGRHSIFNRIIPVALLTRRSVYVTTAFSIFVGIYAYYYKSHLVGTGIS